MAYLIDTIKDTIGNIIYPITQTKAVFDVKSNKYQNDLNDIAVFSEDLTSDIQQDVKLNADTLNNHPDTYFAKQSDISDVNVSLNVLNDDRGYLRTKSINDCNLAINNGKYFADVGSLNSPNNTWAFLLETIAQTGATNKVQTATAFYPISTPITYERKCVNGTWTHWQEITTTETAILSSNDLKNGTTFPYEDFKLTCNRCGNIVSLNGIIKLSTTVAQGTIICQIPIAYRPSISRKIIITNNVNPSNIGNCYINANGAINLDFGSFMAQNEYVFSCVYNL